MNLFYNRNVLVPYKDLPNQLTGREKCDLEKYRKREEIHYQQRAAKRFDSEKNWSTMIEKKNNDIRNEVMRTVHCQKLRNREIPNFLRLARIEILEKRGNPEKSTQGKLSAMSAYSQPELKNPRDMTEPQR